MAQAELLAHYPDSTSKLTHIGGLDILECEGLPTEHLDAVRRLSFVQGIFSSNAQGELTPLPGDPGFNLPDALVHAAKYRGKTNELVTQLAINLAITHCQTGRTPSTLLDPMAGRGTTLLWGLRYGLDVKGIEIDPDAPQDLHRHIKRQTKLHKISHTHQKGFTGKKNKRGDGQFWHYGFGKQNLRLFTGDCRNAPDILSNQRFDLLVTDLPYGIQFKSGSTRLTLPQLIEECIPAWTASLRPGGVMALIFNTYQPSREALESWLTARGFEILPGSFAHRMSESIVRDVLLARGT